MSRAHSALGSSRFWPKTKSGVGFSATSRFANPDFHNWTQVYIPVSSNQGFEIEKITLISILGIQKESSGLHGCRKSLQVSMAAERVFRSPWLQKESSGLHGCRKSIQVSMAVGLQKESSMARETIAAHIQNKPLSGMNYQKLLVTTPSFMLFEVIRL